MGTSVKELLGGSVQIRTELSEGSDFSVLSELEFQSTGNSLHSLNLSGRTDSADGKTDVNGRSDTLVEKFGFQENLSVGNGNDVSWNISRHITSLSLNDWKSSQTATSVSVGHLSGSFKKSGVEIEDITRVSLSSWRSSKKKGHLSVSNGLLGKIVVDNEGVLSVVSEELSDSASGVRSQELKRSGFGGGSGNDDGVFKSAHFAEGLDDVGDSGSLLSDSDVDAEKLFLNVAGIEVLLLVDDGINSNSGLASLSVTNDKLSLSSSDWDQTINGLETGLHWLVDGSSWDNTRGLDFNSLSLFSLDWALSVNWVTIEEKGEYLAIF
mgnify:CR=1 FL=1